MLDGVLLWLAHTTPAPERFAKLFTLLLFGRVDIKLDVVEPLPEASIISPAVTPAFEGTERDNLLCGKCLITLCRRLSVETMRSRFAAPVQLLIKCPKCGVHNKLPAQLGH